VIPNVVFAQQKFTQSSAFGNTTYEINGNTVKFVNNSLDYSLGNLKIQNNYSQTSDSRNFLFNDHKLSFYYKDTKSKTYGNTFGVNYAGLNFSHDNYQSPTAIGIQTARFLLVNKSDLSYSIKDFNLRFSDMTTYNQIVKEYSLTSKKINADLVSSETKFTAVDYWHNNVSTDYSLSLNYDKFN
jgi:hypothetical protein